jgi:hypothetical protein
MARDGTRLPGPSPRGGKHCATLSAPAFFASTSIVMPPPLPLLPAQQHAGAGGCRADELPSDSERRERSHRPLPAQRAADSNELLRLLRMSVFLLTLFIGYCVTRGIAQLGLPSDGRRVWLAGDFAGARAQVPVLSSSIVLRHCCSAPPAGAQTPMLISVELDATTCARRGHR